MNDLILAKTNRPYKALIKEELPEGATADDVLEHLFGDSDGWVNSDYTVREYAKVKTNILQRLLTPFVFIVFMVIFCPVIWLFTGRFGLKSNSLLHNLFAVLTGCK